MKDKLNAHSNTNPWFNYLDMQYYIILNLHNEALIVSNFNYNSQQNLLPVWDLIQGR